jgi:hypothetical protein
LKARVIESPVEAIDEGKPTRAGSAAADDAVASAIADATAGSRTRRILMTPPEYDGGGTIVPRPPHDLNR